MISLRATYLPYYIVMLPFYAKDLDHDAAGDRMTAYLLEHFAQAIDLRYRFLPHKDLNEKRRYVLREKTN